MNSRPEELREASHLTFIIKLRQYSWFSNKLLRYMTKARHHLQAHYLPKHAWFSTSVPGEHPWASARPRASCVGQNSRAGLVVTHHGTTFILPNTLPTLTSQNTGNNRKLEESSTSATYEITGLQSQILSQKEVRTTLVTERSLLGLYFL